MDQISNNTPENTKVQESKEKKDNLLMREHTVETSFPFSPLSKDLSMITFLDSFVINSLVFI